MHAGTPTKDPSVNIVIALFLVNIATSLWHYIDNVMRPDDYLEPWILRRAYIYAEMEITTVFWFLMTPFGVVGCYYYWTRKPQLRANAVKFIYIYCGCSFLAIAHYLVAPPSAFSWDVNGSIMSESLAAVVLAMYVWWQRTPTLPQDEIESKLDSKAAAIQVPEDCQLPSFAVRKRSIGH